ncbi:fumarylacetoacetate hydrolase, partial [Rhizobium leguminosarum]
MEDRYQERAAPFSRSAIGAAARTALLRKTWLKT